MTRVSTKADQSADAAETSTRYQQIARDLLGKIRTGQFPVGTMLPAESQLCQDYHASRYTVREALRWLADYGLIDRKRGLGTVVRTVEPSPAFVYRLSSLTEILRYPEDTYRENAVAGLIQADPPLASRIDCPVGTDWYRIGGLRRSDTSDLPIAWSDIYVLPEFAPLLQAENISRKHVFELIERERGVVIANAQIRIFASSIDGHLARLMQVADDTPALTIVRRYIDETGRNFETTVTIHPQKRFEYAIELRRDRGRAD